MCPLGVQALPVPSSNNWTWWPATHLVFVALVNAQGLGTEAVPHAKMAHQVGEVDGPDAPGQLQLLQSALERPVIQLAQVPVGRQATEASSPQGDAGLGHPSPVAPSATGRASIPQKALSFVMKPYVPPGHNLRQLGHRAGLRVESLNSASPISCCLCDFGQVTALSGLTSFISKMRWLDHISAFLSFTQIILLLNPILPRIPGCKKDKGKAAPGSQAAI